MAFFLRTLSSWAEAQIKKNWVGRISGSHAGFEQTSCKVAIVQGDVQEEEYHGEEKGEHYISRLHDGSGSAEAQESF